MRLLKKLIKQHVSAQVCSHAHIHTFVQLCSCLCCVHVSEFISGGSVWCCEPVGLIRVQSHSGQIRLDWFFGSTGN